MWWEKKKKTEESINSQSKYQIEFSNIDKRGNGEGKLTEIYYKRNFQKWKGSQNFHLVKTTPLDALQKIFKISKMREHPKNFQRGKETDQLQTRMKSSSDL